MCSASAGSNAAGEPRPRPPADTTKDVAEYVIQRSAWHNRSVLGPCSTLRNDSVDLRDYLGILRRRWLSLLVIPLTNTRRMVMMVISSAIVLGVFFRACYLLFAALPLINLATIAWRRLYTVYLTANSFRVGARNREHCPIRHISGIPS